MAFLGLMLLLNLSGCGKRSEEVEVRQRRIPIRRPALARTIETPRVQREELSLAENAPQATTPATEVESGLVYRNEQIAQGPWSVNLVKIDRSRAEFRLTTTLGRGRTIGLGTLSEQVGALPAEAGRPLAAVNGDFYRTEHESFAGDPRGLQIAGGELISAPNGKVAFWVGRDNMPMTGNVVPQFKVTWPDGSTTPFGFNEERHANAAVLYTPRCGPSTRARSGRELILGKSGDEPWLPLRAGEVYSAEVREVRESGNSRIPADGLVLSIGPTLLSRIPRVNSGAVLRISTATTPSLEGVEVAIGGGPVLLRDGKVQRTYTNRADERHPRSAIGWNDQHYFFVQVDGRQHGFSIGMTLAELAGYLARQGCQEAMNLDGGGSSEMWVDGEVVNRPCFGYERHTANGLVLLERPKMAAK